MASSKKKKTQQARARAQTRQQVDKRRAQSGGAELSADAEEPVGRSTAEVGVDGANAAEAPGRAAGLRNRVNAALIGATSGTAGSSTGDSPEAGVKASSRVAASSRTTPSRTTPSRTTASSRTTSATATDADDEPPGAMSMRDILRGSSHERTEFELDPVAPGPINWSVLVTVTFAFIALAVFVLLPKG